jgi:cell division protein FtsZ
MEIFEVKEFEEVKTDNKGDIPAIIKVFGVGGGGSNAVDRMIASGLSGVEFIAANTDIQDLMNKSKAGVKLQIGGKLTRGRGAGGNPSVGEEAAKEDHEKISNLAGGADMTFVTAGMGGGTGTGAASVIARIAREHGALTVGVVTKPFEFEGEAKMRKAEDGIKKLREAVDTLIIIPNENLFKMVDSKTTTLQAFALADDVLRQAVQAITDLITKTGLINIDFADVQSTMKGQGDAHMGMGIGKGDNRAKDAADHAIDNPLLEDTGIKGATRLLVNISGPETVSMVEIKIIMEAIKENADPDVETIYGQTIDPEMGDDIKVTVIATGFKHQKSPLVNNAEQSRRAETTPGDVLSVEHFNRLKQGSNIRSNDNYVGIVNKVNDIGNNLDIPTYIRKNSFEDLDKSVSRSSVSNA